MILDCAGLFVDRRELFQNHLITRIAKQQRFARLGPSRPAFRFPDNNFRCSLASWHGHDKPDIRFIDPHAEGDGRDDDLQVILLELVPSFLLRFVVKSIRYAATIPEVPQVLVFFGF